MAIIKYACPHVVGDDVRAMVDVMYSGWLTQGQEVKKYEKEIARYVGARYAVAFNSATSALYAGYKAMGMQEGTEVVTSPISYVATANAAKIIGAKVYFQFGHTLTGEFVVPVHYSGRPYPYYGERVVEDASHALGSIVEGKHVGSCERSDICVFSTHAIKNITTGEGGVATTNNGDLADYLRGMCNHGWYKDGLRFPGFNFRMTEFQAALGRSQLRRIDAIREQKQGIVDYYNERLAGYVETPRPRDEPTMWHLYEIHLRNKTQRDRLKAYLKRKGIETQIHYKPIYLEKYYQEDGYDPDLCSKAEEFWNTELSLPLHPRLTEDDLEKVVDCVRRFVG